ncbi:hypothetical protein JCGZ_15483 [Jatropha curcas]|uniref:Pectinesterase inhibitor domain-containing protein n=1 Tax=Jatropha curcas TaxID=180498 RepID=A0A067LBR3_JATCU|nr:hypothetical protein JCGZ_15480 [Jatropha curcas]KDP45921.1 hypothetical protein JCGZ_15481 [Jatropha curcas]KDP45923.1 hypothetical protein JCGZ_15483 [Jatropha curcas]
MISTSHQASELLNQSCDKTLYKDFCKEALGSAPASDMQSLTKSALDIASLSANEVLKLIPKLLETSSDASVKQALTDCSEVYQSALDQIKKSTAAVDAKAYNDVNTWISAGMTSSETCEEGFNGVTSPLTSVNTRFSQISSIILTFSNLSAKN